MLATSSLVGDEQGRCRRPAKVVAAIARGVKTRGFPD